MYPHLKSSALNEENINDHEPTQLPAKMLAVYISANLVETFHVFMLQLYDYLGSLLSCNNAVVMLCLCTGTQNHRVRVLKRLCFGLKIPVFFFSQKLLEMSRDLIKIALLSPVTAGMICDTPTNAKTSWSLIKISPVITPRSPPNMIISMTCGHDTYCRKVSICIIKYGTAFEETFIKKKKVSVIS